MPDSNRNRNSIKGNDEEDRTGNDEKNPGYRKLPDNNDPDRTDESISTRGDTSNGKYSKTNVRKEDIDKSLQPDS
jgi:hypothetical protein